MDCKFWFCSRVDNIHGCKLKADSTKGRGLLKFSWAFSEEGIAQIFKN